MALTDKLTAIADAIREKQGKERYVYGEPPIVDYDEETVTVTKTLTKKVGSSNINLETGEANSVYNNGLNEMQTVTFDEIPANTPVHIKLWYGTESTQYDWVVVNNGSISNTPQSYGSWTSRYGGNNAKTKTEATIKEFDWSNDTNTFTFGIYSDPSGQYYGYYAELSVEYEAQEVIQTPIYGEPPIVGNNFLTLAQMPDEIRTLNKINGELKTVTAKTAVSKGDMVQYSENSFTLSRFSDLKNPNDQYDSNWVYDTYPWGISWLKNGQGILWQGVSDTSIKTYVLTKEADGTISRREFGTWAVKDSNTSFLDWVLLNDNQTVKPITIMTGSDNYTYIGSTYEINITNGNSNYGLIPSAEHSSAKRIGNTPYYKGVLNCKSKTIETDTQYKIYIAGNYQRSSTSGSQYCNCVYVDKATGDVSFDTMLIGAFVGFGTTVTDNDLGVIMDVQEIDAESHSYCSFISLQFANYGQLYIHQRSDGSTSQKRMLFKNSTSMYTASMFLARNSISDPVMWAYIEPSDMTLHIMRWDKDKGETVTHQDALVLTTNSKAYGAAVRLKKFSDNIYMAIEHTSNYFPTTYLYWDMTTYTMRILGTASGIYTDGQIYMNTGCSAIELFPNITHVNHQYWLKGCNTDHPQMLRKFQNELVKLDEGLNASTSDIYIFNNATYDENVLKYVTTGDGQFIKLHNNDFAFEPVSKTYIQLYTIDNTPTIGNLLASDNPTGFAVAAEDIPAGGTGQAYVI